MSCSAISDHALFVQILTTRNVCAQNTILVPSPLPSQNTEHSCSFLVRWIFNRVQLHFLIRIDSMFEFSVVPNISSLVIDFEFDPLVLIAFLVGFLELH